MVIRRMRVRVPPQLGGGLASLCGVNAGANTCANPVGATAAPFRALQRGEMFASRRTSDTPKSRNAGPHPQGAAAACGAAGPVAVAGGKDCLRSAAPLVGRKQQAPTA